MTIKSFNYFKEGSTEVKPYRVLITNKDELHENGLALNYLTEEQQTAVIELQRKYEEDLKPFMKAYRSFLKRGIQTMNDVESKS